MNDDIQAHSHAAEALCVYVKISPNTFPSVVSGPLTYCYGGLSFISKPGLRNELLTIDRRQQMGRQLMEEIKKLSECVFFLMTEIELHFHQYWMVIH